MSKEPPTTEGCIVACREDKSPYYDPQKVKLPVRESSFIQIGRGEHAVDVQIATVGDVGLTRLGIGVEAVGTNVLKPNYVGFALPVSWTGNLSINGEIVGKSALYIFGDLGSSIHLRSKSRVVLGVTLPREPFVETIAALRGVDADDVRLNDRQLHLNESVVLEVRTRLARIIDNTCSEHQEHSQREISNDVLGLLTDAYLDAIPESSLRVDRFSYPERVVHLAEERFMASEGKPISLADLCAAAGVSKSTLYKAFHSVCGLPPLAYFQKRQLTRARSLLIDADYERGRVKQAALSCGFTELGRFSAQYRQLFGELPSATLSGAGN